MKKSILILSSAIAIISLSAFSYLTTPKECPIAIEKEIIKTPKLPFFYDYGTRFGGITKTEIQNATSVKDFFPKEHVKRIVSYEKLSLIIIEKERQTDKKAYSKGPKLSAAQRKILLAADYSTSFNLRADCIHRNPETGELEESFYSPHLTIVPEKEVEYIDGKEALLSFLKENSKKEKKAAHQLEKLRPAKLHFTVTKEGKVANVYIGNHSGYEPIDKKLTELLYKLPGKWKTAENSKGEKVDQELVVSYGLEGC